MESPMELLSNSNEQALEKEQQNVTGGDQNPNNQSQWETMARLWLSAFPGANAISTEEVGAWIDSNFSSLPADLQSMPRSEIIDRLLFFFQNYMKVLPNQQVVEENQADPPTARFQRTDQWRPVYSWLESLDRDDPVKTKDISDWLTANPDVKEQLCSKHSRYHLMHYIKKCHLKILKRRDKKKGLLQIDNKPTSPKADNKLTIPEVDKKAASPQVHENVVLKEPVRPPRNPLRNIPKDSELYEAKRNEALRKFEILVALEKKLAPHFSKNPVEDE